MMALELLLLSLFLSFFSRSNLVYVILTQFVQCPYDLMA